MKSRNLKITAASFFMIFLLAGVFWMNDLSLTHDKYSGHFRFPASFGITDMHSATQAVQKRFAASLARIEKRSFASIGHPANDLEALKFGVLEGKYVVTMDGDRVSELSFVDNPQTIGSPAAVGNRLEFFNRFSKPFGISGMPERVSVNVKDRNIIETYKIPGKNNSPDTVIEVTLDNQDRLISLRAEKKSLSKFF